MSELLDAIFAFKPAEDLINVWQLKLKSSDWFQDPKYINPDVNPGLYNKGDVYFGVGTCQTDKGRFSRATKDDITGIGALWLDIDVKGAGHKKDRLPENYEQAWSLLHAALPQPSFLIDSGHGLQAYWLLDNWFEINPDTREYIDTLLLNFNLYWRLYCAKQGLDADSVCDITRVMRLPDSTNCKVIDQKVPVRDWMPALPRNRYTLAQVETWWNVADLRKDALLLEKSKKKAPEKVVSNIPSGDSTPSRSTTLDLNQWTILQENDKRAKLTWEMARPDLPDQSPSSYTMALGRLALNAGWPDEQIEALLIEFRKHHSWDPKLHAIKLTIKKMHETPSGFDSFDSQDPEEKNPISFEAISNSLGLDITEIIRYDTSPPAYVLIAQGKRIHLGGIEGLSDIKRFRNTVAASTGIMTTRFKPDAWDRVVAGMLSLATQDSAGGEATEEGQLIEWIQVYLNSVTVHEESVLGLTAGEPWIEDGHPHIIATAFRGWIAVNLQDRIEARKLGLTLRSIKAEPIKVKTRNVWKLPREVWSK